MNDFNDLPDYRRMKKMKKFMFELDGPDFGRVIITDHLGECMEKTQAPLKYELTEYCNNNSVRYKLEVTFDFSKEQE